MLGGDAHDPTGLEVGQRDRQQHPVDEAMSPTDPHRAIKVLRERYPCKSASDSSERGRRLPGSSPSVQGAPSPGARTGFDGAAVTISRSRAMLVVPGAAFLALAGAVALLGTLPMDAAIRDALLAWGTPPVLTAMHVVNYAGDWRVILPGTLLLFVVFARARVRWWVWLRLMVAAPIAGGGLKRVVGPGRAQGAGPPVPPRGAPRGGRPPLPPLVPRR